MAEKLCQLKIKGGGGGSSSHKDIAIVYLASSNVNATFSFYDSANDTFSAYNSGSTKTGTELKVVSETSAGYPYSITALKAGKYRIYNNGGNSQSTGVYDINATAGQTIINRQGGSSATFVFSSVMVEAL